MIEYYEQLSQAEQEKMQEIIQKLYRQTFILERKYDKKEGRMLVNKDFYFCEKHMEFLKEYLAVAGVTIYDNTELGTIYIQGEATVGEKLPMLATIYLLLFKLIYDEQMAAVSTSVNIVTTLGEVNGKAGEFRLVKALASMTEMRRALMILKKYQLIEVLDTMEELNESTRIIIFPSINVVLMRENILRLLESFAEEGGEVREAEETEEGEAEELEEGEAEEIEEGETEETEEGEAEEDNAEKSEEGKAEEQ